MKKEKLKWHFTKMSIVELNDNTLSKIKGGENDNTGNGDPNETTKISINGHIGSTGLC